jgi:hypothetical protein
MIGYLLTSVTTVGIRAIITVGIRIITHIGTLTITTTHTIGNIPTIGTTHTIGTGLKRINNEILVGNRGQELL